MARYLLARDDLHGRRAQLSALASQLTALETEHVRECNLCGSQQTHILATRDRYGLPFRVALCYSCGLVYQADRFTRASYSEFYTKYYRELVSRFNRAPHDDLEYLMKDQTAYAANLVANLRDYVWLSRDAEALDIGGSTGVVASVLAQQLGGTFTVLDPSEAELAEADKRGLRTVHSTFEEWQADCQYDAIFLCRSIEHLYDLKLSLLKIRELLTPQGLFICDIADFMTTCRKVGPPEAVAKVDHCYWISLEVALTIFRYLGFEILFTFPGSYSLETGFVLRRCDPDEQVIGEEAVTAMLVELQTIRTGWELYSQRPVPLSDLLLLRVYGVLKPFLPARKKT